MNLDLQMTEIIVDSLNFNMDIITYAKLRLETKFHKAVTTKCE